MMPNSKFTKTDISIIVLFFVLYMAGYAWLINPKKETSRTMNRTTPVLFYDEMSNRPRCGNVI